MFTLKTPYLSLDHTLNSGQTFCWQYSSESKKWKGWINNSPCELQLRKKHSQSLLDVYSPSLSPDEVAHYFSLDIDWPLLLRSFSPDPHLLEAFQTVKGLRCIREPWWECIANFICSSLKQIVQIQQINTTLRQQFGSTDAFSFSDSEKCYHFPSYQKIASLDEADLRACKLGYRARHLLNAARQLENREVSWFTIQSLPTPEASKELQKLAGVGEKVAHCILLYADSRYDAFPMDVWVLRLMKELYYPKRKKLPSPQQIHRKSIRLFGKNRGIAQQYLFHWFRTCRTS